MKKKDIEELKAACRDLVDVAKGRKTAEEVGAIVTRPGDPVAPLIRAGLGMTQVEFAALLGVSVRTLQDWEIGRRQPDGPAKSLLKVAAYSPRTVLAALRSA